MKASSQEGHSHHKGRWRCCKNEAMLNRQARKCSGTPRAAARAAAQSEGGQRETTNHEAFDWPVDAKFFLGFFVHAAASVIEDHGGKRDFFSQAVCEGA
jgi:hypothetical protein